MKLAILGGGGFRVPLIYRTILNEDVHRVVDEIVLYDADSARLAAIESVLTALDDQAPPGRGLRRSVTTDLDTALAGADIIFAAIRVGGLKARANDERVAYRHGVIGQETTGVGGLAYALRTLPVMRFIADRVAELAPKAWLINFTNPVGIITQALSATLGAKIIGICDTPIGLARRAARGLGLDLSSVAIDYVGLNHLGWLRGLSIDGSNRLPDLISDASVLGQLEEGKVFGAAWIQALGCLPNEYLHYYYQRREALAAGGSGVSRGEFLLAQQRPFFAASHADPNASLALWTATLAEREQTYMADARATGEQRDPQDFGGYERVALDLMTALLHNAPSTHILNVASAGVIPGMDAAEVVEIPCLVDASGAHPLPLAAMSAAQYGLVRTVKAVEELTIAAAATGSRELAWAAFAQHPLVDGVSTAKALLDDYLATDPLLAQTLRR